MRWWNVFVCAGLFSTAALTAAQKTAANGSELGISDGVRVPSPDGARALVGKGFRILLIDQRTGESRPVATISQREDEVGWSPDGAYFFINDREASNVEKAYVYDAATLVRLDLQDQIGIDIAQYHPRYSRYLLGSDHTYYHVDRWLDARHVDVTLSGYFGGFCLKWDKKDCCKKIYGTHDFLFRYSLQPNGETLLRSASITPAR